MSEKVSISILPEVEDLNGFYTVGTKYNGNKIPYSVKMSLQFLHENEEERKKNETQRVNQENLRKEAEETRKQNETSRIEAENERRAAELLRQGAENQRLAAESARSKAEQQRVTSEEGRIEAEKRREEYIKSFEERISSFLTAKDLNGYATEEWVSDKGYLTKTDADTAYVKLDSTAQDIYGDKTFRNIWRIYGGGEPCYIFNKRFGQSTYRLDGKSEDLHGLINSLAFQWYDDIWAIGNIRSGGTPTFGFGIGLVSEDGKYVDGYLTVTKSSLKYGNNTVLHSGNWSQFISGSGSDLSNYVTVDTAQRITGSKTFVGSVSIKMDMDTSNAKGITWLDYANSNLIALFQYHNVKQRFLLNPIGASDAWRNVIGQYSLVVGNDELTYNTFPILHAGNYNQYISGGGSDLSGYLREYRINGDHAVNIDTLANKSPFILEALYPNGTLPNSGDSWIQLFNWGNQDDSPSQPSYGTQMAAPYTIDGPMYFRNIAKGVIHPWRTLLDSVNFSDYAVKKAGDMMTGKLTVPTIAITGGPTINSDAFISADGSSNVYVNVGGISPLVIIGNSKVIRSSTATAGTISLGSESVRWSGVYSNDGNFSGDLTAFKLHGTTSAPLSIRQVGTVAPTTGQLGTAIGLTIETAGLYGLYSWVTGNGNAHLQVGRSDGQAYNYNLSLQELGGRVGIGAPTPDATLHVNGTIHVTGTGVWNSYQDFPSGAGNTGSDMRFKSHVAPIRPVLDEIMDLEIISYKWNKSGESEKDTFGLKADQLIDKGGIFAKMVHERNDAEHTKWVEYDRSGVVALKGLQELYGKLLEEGVIEA